MKQYRIETDRNQKELKYDCEVIDGINYIYLTANLKEEEVWRPPTIKVIVSSCEVHYRWTPKLHLIKALNSDWFKSLYLTNGFTGAPVECLISADNKNCACISLSDTLNTIEMKTVSIEETGEYAFEIVLMDERVVKKNGYKISIRLDTRDIPYYQTLNEVAKWWETFSENKPAYIPALAKEAMYSTWYSYHQMIQEQVLINECKIAVDFGCKTILIDDGWQTEDNNRGYAYCGDWEPAKSKIADVCAFTKRIHELGMKVMFWYSVPFIGEKSKNFKKFQDMLIDPRADREWHVLDPRYPEVRKFIIGTYEKALEEWDLDGFKLDFVDEFVLTPFSGSAEDFRRDYESFAEAADKLMKDCISYLKEKKPDIMLEFRQTYNGPRMRTYGNIFRAVDCPMDDIENRVRITDIRLIAGKTAVHSDMIMWNKSDSVESAAMQIINVLFSVPQISMRLEELPLNHFKMLKFYCSLWHTYRDAFINGEFRPLNPVDRYSILMGIDKDTMVSAYYSCHPINIEKLYSIMVFINGTYEELLLLKGSEEGCYRATVYDCIGNIVKKEAFTLTKELISYSVPKCGTLILVES